MSHGIFWLPGLIAAILAALVIAWAVWPRRHRCRCGHDRFAHQHYRRGSDCGRCPEGGCRRFRRRPLGPLGRLRALGLVDEALRRAEQDEDDPGGPA